MANPKVIFKKKFAIYGGTANFVDAIFALANLLFPWRLINGPKIVEFENAFAKKIECKHAISFSTGRLGLYGILKALNIGEGDEVLLQVPTHIVVPNAIKYSGAKPVYIDCNLTDYNMDLSKISKQVTKNAKALILQHTFGIPVDIKTAQKLADKHNLVIIEDCVHALGAKYNGKMVGTFGKAAFFSTEETKVISTTMGGMVTTDDDVLASKLRAFKNQCNPPGFWISYGYVLKFILYYFLLEPHFHRLTRSIYEFFGNRHPLPKATTKDDWYGKIPEKYETRLSNAQAAIGIRQLYKLEKNLAHRKKIVNLYQKELMHLGLKNIEISENCEPSWVRYPIWVVDQQQAFNQFLPYGLLGLWFTSLLEESVSLQYGDYVAGSCPNAEKAVKHLVNLPTHQHVKKADTKILVSAIKNLIT